MFDAGNTAYHWDNHVLYKAVGEGFSAVRFDGGTDEVTLKQGTVFVAPYAFSQTVKKVNFPDSVRRIEHHAFEQCCLKEINLNEGLEVIDYLAFAGNEIHRVWLPGTLNYICVSWRFIILGFGRMPLQRTLRPMQFKTMRSTARILRFCMTFPNKKEAQSLSLQAKQWIFAERSADAQK